MQEYNVREEDRHRLVEETRGLFQAAVLELEGVSVC